MQKIFFTRRIFGTKKYQIPMYNGELPVSINELYQPHNNVCCQPVHVE